MIWRRETMYGISRPRDHFRTIPAGYRLAQVFLFLEGGTLAFTGLLTAILGGVTLLSGARWAVIGLAALGVGCAQLVLAGSLCLFGYWISDPSAFWYRVSALLQAILLVIAIVILVQVPGGSGYGGTDGPLADGGYALIALVSMVFMAFPLMYLTMFAGRGAVLTLWHLWRQAWIRA